MIDVTQADVGRAVTYRPVYVKAPTETGRISGLHTKSGVVFVIFGFRNRAVKTEALEWVEC